MTQVVGQDQTTLNYGAGAGVAANGNSGGLGTGATGADSSSRMWHQRPRANRGAGGRGAGSSGIESVAENRRVPNIMRQTPAEIKSELIRVMLEPIFEVFGPIAVRKAIDRIPNDCWWPLDPDVRAMIDVTARKRMVHIALEMKRQQKLQQQMQRQQRLEQQRQQQRNKGRETKSEKTQQKRQQSPTEVESKEKESEKEKVVKVTTQDPSSQQQQQREQKEKMRQEEIGLDPEMEALRRQNSRHRSESQSRRSVLLDRLVRRSVVSSSGVDDLFDFTGETQGINSDSGNDELVEKDNTPEIPTADHLPKEEGPHWRRVRKRASAPWRSVQRWMTRQRSEPMMEPNIDFMSEVEVEERFGIVIEGENESSDLSVSKSIFRKMRRSTMMVEK
ncbi:hypothetical protein BGW38_004994 [Lunasporangiospora selenospora]|uniref:Uncharacterized protein n=1 Tax=Lunasporangiospora selenospora TaxID=979761 RepID=A0A9P6FNJ6_9FUNG|nr:hypothetical protein BGW38_004994 [Lunasporangiospora selenospora]